MQGPSTIADITDDRMSAAGYMRFHVVRRVRHCWSTCAAHLRLVYLISPHSSASEQSTPSLRLRVVTARMLAILLAVLAHSLLRIPTAFAQESEAVCGKGFEWVRRRVVNLPRVH